MPRGKRRTTQTGAPAQKIESVTGQRYGEGTAQQAMQRAMPAPQIDNAGTGQKERERHLTIGQQLGPGPNREPLLDPPPNPRTPSGPQAQATPEELMQIAQQMQGVAGLFTQPTARPNEPVTAGLPIGPGAGPEAMQMRRGSPTANVLAELARATGDTYLLDLAARSRP